MPGDKAPFPYAAALVGGAILVGVVAFVIVDPSILKSDPRVITETKLEARPHPEPPIEPEKVESYPPNYNFGLATHGAVAAGGRHPERLIDGDSTHYNSGAGFATARLDTKPPEAFVVRLKD